MGAAEDSAACRPDSPDVANEGGASQAPNHHLQDYLLRDLLPVACLHCSVRAGVAVDMAHSIPGYAEL